MSWSTCCGLKKLDQKNLNDNNNRQRIHEKLKYCVKTWTNNKPMLAAIKIPEGLHGNSVRLLQEGNLRSISLEYSSEILILILMMKIIELLDVLGLEHYL